jgi:hypothetical protein
MVFGMYWDGIRSYISFFDSMAIPPFLMEGFAALKKKNDLALIAKYNQTGKMG